jgi:hypothetical protein
MTASRPNVILSALRVLGALVLVALVVLVTLAFYVQTRHGFRHVIVPLATAAVPGTFSVRDGFLQLRGTLELEGLVFADATAGVAVEAERVFLSVSPLSLIRDTIPLVHEVQVNRAAVRLSRTRAESAEPGGMTLSTRDTVLPIVPAAVERGHVEDLTVIVHDAHRTITAEGVTLDLNQLGAGRHGSLGLRAHLRLDRGPQEAPRSASVALDVGLDVNAAGTQIKWTGSNTLRIREGRDGSEAGASGGILVDQTLSGEYDPAQGTMQASSTLTARKGKAALGSAAVTLAVSRSESAQTMDASLTFQDVNSEALNAWLDDDSAVRFHSALINGQVLLRKVGARYAIRSSLVGQRVQVRSEAGTTPALDLSFRQVASFDTESHELLLETLDLAVTQGTRPLLTGKLDRPFKLPLDQAQAATAQGGVEAGEAATWTVSVQDVDVANLRPWVALSGRDVAGDVSAGRLNGTVVVSAREGGGTVDLSGRLQASSVMMEGALGAGRVGPLSFDNQVHARLNNLTTLEFDPWTIVAALKGKPVGEIRATGSFRMAAPAKLLVLDGSLVLRELPGEALNPVLAFWSRVRIQAARLSGQASVKLADNRLSWEADLRGKYVSLRVPDLANPTPPLDLAMTQAGSFDRTTGELRVSRSRAQALDKGRAVIMAALDRPLSVNFNQAKPEVPGLPQGRQPVTLTVEIRRLGVEQLRPRLALLGINAMEAVKTGVLDGRLQAQWHGAADTATVTGGLTAAGLRFERGAARSRGPVTLIARVGLTVRQGARVELSDTTLEVVSGKTPRGTLRIAGSAALADASTDLTLDASAGDVGAVLDAFAWLDERQRRVLHGGLLQLRSRIVGSGPSQPLTVQATMRVSDLRVRMGEAGTLTYSLAAQGDLEVNAARTELQFTQAGMTLESRGGPVGRVTVTGRWPLRSGNGAKAVPEGAMTITVKDWDGGPLADLFALTPGRASGPIPINAEIALAQDPASGTLTVRGHEILGPIRVERKDGGPLDATLRLEHELRRDRDEVQVASLALTGERSDGSPDRVTLKGAVGLGRRPHVQLKGDLASLDAGWYTALFRARDAHEQPGADRAHREEDGRAARAEQPHDIGAMGVPLDLDADLTIGNVRYRPVMIGPGRLIAKGTGDRLTITLEQTGFAEGTVQSELLVVVKDRQPEFTWSAKGESVDMNLLAQAWDPGIGPRFTGVGSFTTSGTGRGHGETVKHSLSGTAVLDVVDGKVVRAPLLAFLAKYTRIKEFEGMDFDRIHGELRAEEGWIHVTRVQVDSSLARLEGSGKIGWDGRLDGRIMTKIGPSQADKVRIPCVTSLLKGPDGFLALPVAVTVKGTLGAPAFGTEAATTQLAKEGARSVAGAVLDVLRGCREKSPPPTQAVPGTEGPDPLKEVGKKVLKGLLKGKQD